MNATTLIGLSLIAVPFVLIGIGMVKTIGWRGFFFCFGFTSLIAVTLALGCYLLFGP